MSTATKKSAADLAAEAEVKAADLRAQAEAERAEAERRHAEWQAERDRLEPTFWTEQRAGFLDRHQGRVDEAWSALAEAIRAGQPGVAEWTTYRAAVKWRHSDRLTVDGWFLRRAEQAYEQRAEGARKLQSTLRLYLVGGGSSEARTAANMGLDLGEWQKRRDAALEDASAVLGREHTSVLDALHALPGYVGQRPATLGHGNAGAGDIAPHGCKTYAEAVSKVTEQMASEVVDQHQAERRAALQTFLDEQTGAEPR